MSYAIIQTGGKQYKVKAGEILKIEKLEASKANSKIEFKEILAYGDDNSIEIAKYSNKLFCLMFHPERKNFSQKIIDQYFKKILKIK